MAQSGGNFSVLTPPAARTSTRGARDEVETCEYISAETCGGPPRPKHFWRENSLMRVLVASVPGEPARVSPSEREG